MNMARNIKQKNNKMMSLSKDAAGRIVFVRILIYVLVAFLTVSFFDYVKSTDFVKDNPIREFEFIQNTLPVIEYIAGGILLLSVAYFVFTLVKKIDTSAHYVTPSMLTLISAYVLAFALSYDKFRIAPSFFYTLSAIACVLVIVYYVYIVLLYKK